MLIKDFSTFDEFYYFEEKLFNINPYWKKFIDYITSVYKSEEIRRVLNLPIDKFVQLSRSDSELAKLTRSLIVILAHVPVILSIKNLTDNKNLKQYQEYIKNHPELVQQAEQEVVTATKSVPEQKLSNNNSDINKEVDYGIFNNYKDYIKKVIYYETSGTYVPRKKYWDVNAFRNGYGTFWNEKDPVKLTDQQATKKLIDELTEQSKLVDSILKINKNIKVNSFSEKIPLIDIAFNAGIGTLKKMVKNSNSYKQLLKNSVTGAYERSGKVFILQKGLLKRRLDMIDPKFSNLPEEEKESKINSLYDKMDKTKQLTKK